MTYDAEREALALHHCPEDGDLGRRAQLTAALRRAHTAGKREGDAKVERLARAAKRFLHVVGVEDRFDADSGGLLDDALRALSTDKGGA